MFIRAIEKNEICSNAKIPSLATLYIWAHKKKLIKPNCARFFFFKRRKKQQANFQILKRNIIHRGSFFKGSNFPPGHFEIDLVLSPNNKGGILTLTEPATLMIYSRHVATKSVKDVLRAINSILSNELSPEDIITITSDNGREFFGYRYVEKRYNISWFFCDPYRSTQRASNERLNRDIRVHYPKGFNFATITPSELQVTIDTINDRVRKKFSYLTAQEKKKEIKNEIPGILKSHDIICLIKAINDNQYLFCS
jgi:IS30 family transposase